MTRIIKTSLDEEYLRTLKKCRDMLFKINQKAVKLHENNVKYSSCSFIELLDTLIENMEES